MGNRAFVTSVNGKLGVYLHWNGGYDSVSAFLEYCKLKGYRPFEDSYGMARFIQVVSNYFGGSVSIGVEPIVYDRFGANFKKEDYDNGIYYVKGWDIVRRDFSGVEQKNYKLKDMLKSIDEAQPVKEQLGAEFFDADIVPTSEIKLGDIVWVFDPLDNKFNKGTVVGFGSDRWVNGTRVNGMPYVDLYSSEACKMENNINNYLREESYRVNR